MGGRWPTTKLQKRALKGFCSIDRQSNEMFLYTSNILNYTSSQESRGPTSLCWRRRAGQFWSAAAHRRSQKIGGGGALRRWRRKKFFTKIPEKISSYPKKNSDDLF